jgi:cell division protein FtsA
MTGSRLEVNVHVVTGSSVVDAEHDRVRQPRRGSKVVDTVLEQMAASESVLTADEKELGVALVDIGGGTTDFAVFERGSLWHTGVLPVGGRPLHQRHRRRAADADSRRRKAEAPVRAAPSAPSSPRTI